MKICSQCKESKLLDEFNKNSKKKDGYQTMCRDCSKSYYARYYKNGREQERLRAKRQEERTLIRSYIREVKDVPCKDCNQRYPWYVMEFDHLRDKTGNISNMISTHSLAKVKEEIEKCEIVCANCHRQRTFDRAYSGIE